MKPLGLHENQLNKSCSSPLSGLSAPPSSGLQDSKFSQEKRRIKTLNVAHTPDPDDAFAWYALAENPDVLSGIQLNISTPHIDNINESCIRDAAYDIAAISSAAFPFMQDQFWILSAGASVGRGYGPAFVANQQSLGNKSAEFCINNANYKNWTIAIPGEHTTAAALLKLFYPGATYVTESCDRIPYEVAAGKYNAGVLIHENLMNWEANGLVRIECLGSKWEKVTNLPIPVGLNVVHHRIGESLARRVNTGIRWSMQRALEQTTTATDYAYHFSTSPDSGNVEEYIHRFANADTLSLPDDCIEALNLFWKMTFDAGITPKMNDLQIICDQN